MRLSACLLCAALAALLLASPLSAADKEAPKVEEGKPAPDFTLPVTGKDGKKISLKELRGEGAKAKNVVLFFFPKAMTSGCTKQCKGFTALESEFAKLDTIPVGISTDNLDAQIKFTEKDKLSIPLFADSEKSVAKTYGVLRPTGGLANRVTFVIDKKGIVRKIFKVSNAEGNPAEALEYVKTHLAGK